jgi:AraC-like DNA-binding protein
MTTPWGVKVPEQSDRAVFYIMSRGSAYLEVEGVDKPIALAGGDVALLPHGTPHTMRDSLDTQPVAIEELMANACPTHKTVDHGGGGPMSLIVSGYFSFENRVAAYFLDPLDAVVHIPADEAAKVPYLDATLKFLAMETASDAPGAQTIVERLTDVLFVEILRAHIAQLEKTGDSCEKQAGIMRAVVDPQLGNAFKQIHAEPQHPWTVEELAKRVNMSRTGFAVKFAQKAGISPLEYVRKWRMQKAGDFLRQGVDNLEEIAARVGYESGAAFSKAFKREMGVPPGTYRREAAGV